MKAGWKQNKCKIKEIKWTPKETIWDYYLGYQTPPQKNTCWRGYPLFLLEAPSMLQNSKRDEPWTSDAPTPEWLWFHQGMSLSRTFPPRLRGSFLLNPRWNEQLPSSFCKQTNQSSTAATSTGSVVWIEPPVVCLRVEESSSVSQAHRDKPPCLPVWPCLPYFGGYYR